MDKPYQINNPAGIYFITFTIVEWIDVFTRQRYQDIIVDSLNYCQKQKGLILYAWCIMSNHIHLIVSAQETYDLSAILRDFKKHTAKQILKSIQEEPESRRSWMLWLFESAGKRNSRNTKYQFWRHDNHAEELVTNTFMQQKLDYIHQNPVQAGLVDRAENWVYSSARDYAGNSGLLHIVQLS